MNLGELFILIGIATSFFATALRAYAIRYPDKKTFSLSANFSILTFVVTSAALLLLTYYFLSSNMDYYYVWSNSSTDLAALYKLSGVWAGAEGSVLLWIWFISLALVIEIFMEPKRKYLSDKFHSFFQATLSGIIFLFMLILYTMHLFRETDPSLLVFNMNGAGMNLLLQTPEMAIHPPVIFGAYAFAAVGFASALAYFMTKQRNWHMIALPWTRYAWLLLTLGIGIGALWAYYVIGWGGYWAWDPVETSSLIPWFVMTAFLHTLVRFGRKGDYALASPLLGQLSFISIMFATFATRAGSIWSSSVHAFPGGEGATPFDRFIYLLSNDASIFGIFSIMILLLIIAVFFVYREYRSMPKKDEAQEQQKISSYISEKNNMTLAALLMAVTAIIMLLLLFKNINLTQTANFTEFNQKMSLFFAALMIAMTLCLIWRYLGKEKAFQVSVGLIALSILLALIGAGTNSFDWLVAFSLPSYLAAFGASIFKLWKSWVPRSLMKTLRKMSPHIIHLGIAMILVSFVISTNMQVVPADIENENLYPTTSIGGQITAGDYSARLVALTEETGIAPAGLSIYQNATIDILKSGTVISSGLVLTNIINQEIGTQNYNKMKHEALIFKTLMNDIYLDFVWTDNTSCALRIKVIPFMNTLWIGLTLVSVGILARTLTWKQAPKPEESPPEKKRDTKGPKRIPEEAVSRRISAEEDDVDYESLVEEELKRFKEKKSRQ